MRPTDLRGPAILVGIPDPIEQRTGLEEDIHNAVPLPVLPAEVRPPKATINSPEGRRYVSGSPAAVAEHRLTALCLAVERAGVAAATAA